MFKSVTGKSITAIAAAGLVASLATFLTSGVPETKAEGEHLSAFAKGAACSLHGWPYYGANLSIWQCGARRSHCPLTIACSAAQRGAGSVPI
jgi:hypothetical protein